MDERKLDSIESAIADIKEGKVIIVVDDENRENEGDFICAAECATPEIVNFMATHARGLICAPLHEELCNRLGLDMMVGKNTALHETPFTISVDLIGHGCTTGISASDRAKTIRALVDENTKPEDLGRPGHIFPLKSKDGGVLRRVGHTEASVDFARLAGFKPAGVLVEIMNEDGTMARYPDLLKVAEKFDLKLVSIKDLIAYRLDRESLISCELSKKVELAAGEFTLKMYRQEHSNDVHMALIKGEWAADESVLVRVYSSNQSGAFFDLDSTNDLKEAIEVVAQNGKGVILQMNQEGRGLNLLDKLKAQEKEKLSAQEMAKLLKGNMDSKDYGVGAQILRDLNISKIKLLSNSKVKRSGLLGYGLEIVDHVSIKNELVNNMS